MSESSTPELVVSEKRLPATPFPKITLPTLGSGQTTLGVPEGGHSWQLVVVYRGAHCINCHKYLTRFKKHLSQLNKIGFDVIVVTADAQEITQPFIEDIGYEGRVATNLSVEHMKKLGLYITDPASSGLDYPHPEPGVFVINPEGLLTFLDMSNVSFFRPDLDDLVKGLTFLVNYDYRFPGTYVV